MLQYRDECFHLASTGLLPYCTGHVNVYESGKEPLTFPFVIPFSPSLPLLSSPRYTPSGFELCSPRATGQGAGPAVPALGTHARAGRQEGAVLETRAARWATQKVSCPLFSSFVCSRSPLLLLLLLLLCPGGTASPFPGQGRHKPAKPGPASQPRDGRPSPASCGGMMLMIMGATWVV